MRWFVSVLVLQLVVSTYGFHRLGTVDTNSGNEQKGRVYLIDANTIFLFEFKTNVSLLFANADNSSQAWIGPLNWLSGMYDFSGDILDTPTINIYENGDSLIASFYVPNNVYVPCNAEYLGRFEKPKGGTSHDLDGYVFLDRSQNRFFIAGFVLDGSAPASFFWLDSTAEPSSAGIRAGYNGGYALVTDILDGDVNITYPPGHTDAVFTTLSVWCVDFSVSFGQVNISWVSPYPFSCNTFGPVLLQKSPISHLVTAQMYVLGPSVIGLKGLHYDGNPPATWYWAGLTAELPDGYIVPDQFGSLEILDTEIVNENIIITLPNSTSVCDTHFFSIYCVRASVTFGTVYLNVSFGCSNCPVNCKTDIPTPRATEYHCRNIGTEDYLRAEYLFDETNGFVTFKFHTCNLEPEKYIAFGLSSGNNSLQMAPNGDAIVCYYSATGEAVCTDYTLTARTQCANSGGGAYSGACPDHVLVNGVDDAQHTQVEHVNGRTTFTTTRNLVTGDTNDQDITSTPQYIIWSKGATFMSPTGERWVLKHAAGDRAAAPMLFDFSSNSTCDGELKCPTTIPPDDTPWTIPKICLDSESDPVTAYIGNTGGSQGYSAITGQDGWGISWYLNGLLVPEVYILRGTTVTFNVNGGNDDSIPTEYHPFYLTNSNEGGIITSLEAGGVLTETVYAGLSNNATYIWGETTGEYCEWEETAGNGNQFNSWSAYKDSLTSSCPGGKPAGQFEWTTDANTPDTVYYQCATHRLLGWKIYVVSELPSTCPSTGHFLLPFSLLLLMAVVLTLFYGY